jgi:hypothetical protein
MQPLRRFRVNPGSKRHDQARYRHGGGGRGSRQFLRRDHDPFHGRVKSGARVRRDNPARRLGPRQSPLELNHRRDFRLVREQGTYLGITKTPANIVESKGDTAMV